MAQRRLGGFSLQLVLGFLVLPFLWACGGSEDESGPETVLAQDIGAEISGAGGGERDASSSAATTSPTQGRNPGVNQELTASRTTALVLAAIEKIARGDASRLPNPEEQATFFRPTGPEDIRAFRAAGKRLI